MKPERWQQVDQLFQSALEREPEERAAFISEACGSDESLRREVEALLAADGQAGTLIEAPAYAVAAPLIVEDDAQSLVGKSIGHFQIVSLVGKGGMGEVYLAQDTRLNRKVALKVLPAQFTQDTERVRRFEREARAASALNHPNILAVYEIGQANSGHYIVTEFVDGETLRQHCAQAKVTLLEALEIAIQVASALAAAHAAGVVHRDIKPENVMLRQDGYVKVLDFGLAKLLDKAPEDLPEVETGLPDTTTPGVVMGTVQYMSPEQARGLKVDARTDIWSLGVMLYEMVAGRRPFSGSTTSDTIAAILDKEPAPLLQHSPHAPAELGQMVAKALEKEREYRYQSASDFLLDLKRLKRKMESGAESARTAQLESTDSSKRTRSKQSVALWSAALALLVAGIAIGLYWWVSRRGIQTDVLRVVPFTSFSGSERTPAFSPDGNQIAFSWGGEKDDNFDIYVKLIGAGTPLRLTTDPARDTNPAWSPDGRYIAFVRIPYPTGDGGIYLVPALGGPERKLLSGNLYGIGPFFSWSSDGKLIAFPGRDQREPGHGVHLLTLDSREVRKLTSNPPGIVDSSTTFSPDGTMIAFVRFVGGTSGDIYLVPVAGGEPKRLTRVERVTNGLAWTPDGREIVFPSDGAGGDFGLWRIAVSGGTPERLPVSGTRVLGPALSRHGHRLAYTISSEDVNIWRLNAPRSANQPNLPSKFISSTLWDGSPQFSPDGKRVVFTSDRSGTMEVWICDSDGEGLAPLTSLGATRMECPRWSPDGRQILFETIAGGKFDLYVMSADGGKPRRLPVDLSPFDGVPNWSRDGRWIYFHSSRSGKWEVWKVPFEGGQAVQVTKQGGYEAFESPDGKFLYFAKDPTAPGLWRVPVDGGEAALVSDRVHTGYWAVLERGLYFVNPVFFFNQQVTSPSTIEFLDFVTGKTTQIARLDKPMIREIGGGLTVSPDGKWILYQQRDRNESDIMLVEGFR